MFLPPEYQFYFEIMAWCILAIGLTQDLIYLLELPAAWLEFRKHSHAEDTESAWQFLLSDTAPPISLIIPAYNEQATIVESVRSGLALKYPDLEIVVVNDGSKDETLQTLINAFQLKPVTRAHNLTIPHAPIHGVYGSKLYPRLLVIDKENGGGKANASNAGINFARNPLFCVIDADSLLEGEALLRAVRPFLEEPKQMIAVGGTIRILNGCLIRAGQIKEVRLPTHFLPLVQNMEYIRAFLMARLAWSYWGMLGIISGAFGIFRRDIALEAGGYSINCIGEDYELVIKMHRAMREKQIPYAMRYVPEPVCWTEGPETLETLGNQRKRWQRGALQVFFKHRRMLLNPRYGKIGMLALVHSLIVDVIGPFAEFLGYIIIPILWAMGVLNMEFMLAYIAVFFGFGIFISICTLSLEEMQLMRVPRTRDLLRLAGVAVIENFGYRQLNNIWRVIGWLDFLRGKKGWGQMTRKGFGAA
ncbi:MAG: glycosyltransferase family 2 protein [Alphaproteobacteria bacterium]|nr:MAG: glycosyltransferase family 2 protein [Alphaproteobacteria bacterium]